MQSTKQNQHTTAELPCGETLSSRENETNWLTNVVKLIWSRIKEFKNLAISIAKTPGPRKTSDKTRTIGATRTSASFILIFWSIHYCQALTKESTFAPQITEAPNHPKIPTNNPATSNIFTKKYEIARIADFYERKYNLERKDLLKIISITVENAQAKKINPFVVLAIISHESNFVANVKNSSGATGLMQIVTQVHHHRFKAYGGSHSALKPEVNIKIGTEILEECIRKMKSVRGGLRCYAGTVKGNDRGFSDYVLREATYVRNKSKKKSAAANT